MMLRSFGRDRRATASLEFVIVAPVLIAMALGMVETVRFVRSKSVMVSAAMAMADLVAAQQTVTPGTAGSLHDLCTGAQYTMLPLPATSLGMSVSSFTYPSGTAAVRQDWQNNGPCPAGIAAPNAAQSMAAASAMLVNRGDSVIAVHASYTYVPLVSTILPTTTFSQTVYARPRFGAVLCPTC